MIRGVLILGIRLTKECFGGEGFARVLCSRVEKVREIARGGSGEKGDEIIGGEAGGLEARQWKQ